MRMEGHLPRPGVQNGANSRLCFPPRRGQFQKRGGRGLEQQLVDDARVGEGHRPQFRGQGEHDVEMVGRYEPVDALGHPFRRLDSLAGRAVAIAARIVPLGAALTVLAHVHVPAERGGAAGGHVAQDLALPGCEDVLTAVACPMAAEDVRHLEAHRRARRNRRARVLGHRLRPELAERARRGANEVGSDVNVPGGGFDAFVPEQDLHDAHVYAVLQKMSGKRMPEPVQGGSTA